RANVLRNTVVEVVRASRFKQASEAEIARLQTEVAVPAPAHGRSAPRIPSPCPKYQSTSGR
ncbi:hypothetical protein ACC724_39500, partial [Rhizobium ruizarguesonis]